MNLERVSDLIHLLRSSYIPTFEFERESFLQTLSDSKSLIFEQVFEIQQSTLSLPYLIQILTSELEPNDRYLEVNRSGEWTTFLAAILHDRPIYSCVIQASHETELTLDDSRILNLPDVYLEQMNVLQIDSEMGLSDVLVDLKETEPYLQTAIVLLPIVTDYRLHLLNLLTIVPFLPESALILTPGANYPWINQGNQDLIHLHPQIKLILDLSLKNSNLGDGLDGLQVIGIGNYWANFYEKNIDFNPHFLENLSAQFSPDSLENYSVSLVNKYCFLMDHYLLYQQTIQNVLRDAVICHEQGDREQAKYLYWQILEQDRNQDLAWANLSTIAFEENNRDEALQFIYTAATINPKNDRHWRNLGLIYKRSRDFNQSIYYFQKALQANNQLPTNYLGLAKVLEQVNRVEEADFILQQGCGKFPLNLILWIKKLLLKPLIYKNSDEIDQFHSQLINHLQQILQFLRSEPENLEKLDYHQINEVFEALDIAYFAYQGLDLITIATTIANISTHLLRITQPNLIELIEKQVSAHQSDRPITSTKIRIGYLGTCLKDHVIGYLSSGWIQFHDRSQFEIFCYSLSSETDQIAKTFQQYSDRFYIFQNNNIGLFQQIFDDKIDILVFLDLNVGTHISWLSVLRLAPIQCGFWGNPMTSGSPEIDYFLSSHLMESWSAKNHYSEALIYLPNIASCYLPEAISIVPLNPQDFGLSPDRVIYLFTQTLLKHLPRYDYIFAEIARQVSHAQFIFLERPDEYIAAAFFDRLADAFMTRNLNIHDYCITLPVLPKDKFYALQRLAHVALDSFGWSGGVTTLDAIACDLPVVTYPGEFMRGRHSYGILQLLGVTETIAHSEKEYIDIAVQLGLDRIWNDQIREKIKRNKQKLYGDQNCIKGLETFYRCVFDQRHRLI